MAKPSQASDSDDSQLLHPVFIDTSLDTHFVTVVSNSDTVSSFKQRIRYEHALCFPDIGKINITALKVKRRGLLYRLSESMLVRSVFVGFTKNWVLSADVDTLKKRGTICTSCDLDDGQLLLSGPEKLSAAGGGGLLRLEDGKNLLVNDSVGKGSSSAVVGRVDNLMVGGDMRDRQGKSTLVLAESPSDCCIGTKEDEVPRKETEGTVHNFDNHGSLPIGVTGSHENYENKRRKMDNGVETEGGEQKLQNDFTDIQDNGSGDNDLMMKETEGGELNLQNDVTDVQGSLHIQGIKVIGSHGNRELKGGKSGNAINVKDKKVDIMENQGGDQNIQNGFADVQGNEPIEVTHVTESREKKRSRKRKTNDNVHMKENEVQMETEGSEQNLQSAVIDYQGSVPVEGTRSSEGDTLKKRKRDDDVNMKENEVQSLEIEGRGRNSEKDVTDVGGSVIVNGTQVTGTHEKKKRKKKRRRNDVSGDLHEKENTVLAFEDGENTTEEGIVAKSSLGNAAVYVSHNDQTTNGSAGCLSKLSSSVVVSESNQRTDNLTEDNGNLGGHDEQKNGKSLNQIVHMQPDASSEGGSQVNRANAENDDEAPVDIGIPVPDSKKENQETKDNNKASQRGLEEKVGGSDLICDGLPTETSDRASLLPELAAILHSAGSSGVKRKKKKKSSIPSSQEIAAVPSGIEDFGHEKDNRDYDEKSGNDKPDGIDEESKSAHNLAAKPLISKPSKLCAQGEAEMKSKEDIGTSELPKDADNGDGGKSTKRKHKRNKNLTSETPLESVADLGTSTDLNKPPEGDKSSSKTYKTKSSTLPLKELERVSVPDGKTVSSSLLPTNSEIDEVIQNVVESVKKTAERKLDTAMMDRKSKKKSKKKGVFDIKNLPGQQAENSIADHRTPEPAAKNSMDNDIASKLQDQTNLDNMRNSSLGCEKEKDEADGPMETASENDGIDFSKYFMPAQNRKETQPVDDVLVSDREKQMAGEVKSNRDKAKPFKENRQASDTNNMVSKGPNKLSKFSKGNKREADATPSSSSKSTKNTKFQNKRASGSQLCRGKELVEDRKASAAKKRVDSKKSENKNRLLGQSGNIFKDITDSVDENGRDYSGDSTRTPSDNSSSSGSSDGGSSAEVNSSQKGSSSFKQVGQIKKDFTAPYSSGMKLDTILRSSSRYKKAKLIASLSQPNEDMESQPVDFVPDSQANS